MNQVNCKGGSVSLGLLRWLIGLVENKPAKARFSARLLCWAASLEKTLSTQKGSSQALEVEEGRVGLPDLQQEGLGTWETVSRGCKQNRNVSWDWHSEPHVKASQAACELALLCSIRGTSGGSVLSWLFPAASLPLPGLCQISESDCPFLFPSYFLEEAASDIKFLCGSQEQCEKI